MNYESLLSNRFFGNSGFRTVTNRAGPDGPWSDQPVCPLLKVLFCFMTVISGACLRVLLPHCPLQADDDCCDFQR